MESGDYTIKLADKEDIEGLSKMLYKTEDKPEEEWGRGSDKERLRILQRLMLLKGNRFFYKNFKVLKNEKELIGFFLAFEGKKLKFKTLKSDIVMFKLQKGMKNKIKFIIEIIKYMFYRECFFNEYYLSNIFIKEKYRGLGYSHILLEDVLSEAILNKYKKISLRANNGKLVEFYKEFGYKLAKKNELKMILKI